MKYRFLIVTLLFLGACVVINGNRPDPETDLRIVFNAAEVDSSVTNIRARVWSQDSSEMRLLDQSISTGDTTTLQTTLSVGKNPYNAAIVTYDSTKSEVHSLYQSESFNVQAGEVTSISPNSQQIGVLNWYFGEDANFLLEIQPDVPDSLTVQYFFNALKEPGAGYYQSPLGTAYYDNQDFQTVSDAAYSDSLEINEPDGNLEANLTNIQGDDSTAYVKLEHPLRSGWSMNGDELRVLIPSDSTWQIDLEGTLEIKIGSNLSSPKNKVSYGIGTQSPVNQ